MIDRKLITEEVERNKGTLLSLPEMRILYCYDKAVVSFKLADRIADNHINVPYGLFFRRRLSKAVAEVSKRMEYIIKGLNN